MTDRAAPPRRDCGGYGSGRRWRFDRMCVLWSAVDRVSREGEAMGPDQRVTPLEGLRAMTVRVAGQYRGPASQGSLEAGELADRVIVSADPLEVEPMAIEDIKVLEASEEETSIHEKRYAGRGPC